MSEQGEWTSRRGVRRSAVILATFLAALSTGGHVAAVPPPDNPSDSELREGTRTVQRRADAVGRLANELSEVESRLNALRAEIATKREDANKARVDHERAVRAADEAERAARRSAEESERAARELRAARGEFDRFVAGSYKQGGLIGSGAAYIGSDSPRDLLARAQLLGAVGESHLGTLDRLDGARMTAANADADARRALRESRERRRAAEVARSEADRATADAVEHARRQQERLASVERDKERVERELDSARDTVRGLRDRRREYERWQQEQAAASEAAQGTPAAAPAPAPAPHASAPASSQGAIETVVARATAQLGVPYAWGGGDVRGPTLGIRDGGVADAHGDYRKVGFDCSGLMIHAFAPVTTLTHYSGYQYNEGRRVPLSRMRRGDMLFWGPGRIHHVALYLGDGRMVEAPYSGSQVRITPVRYEGIMPYAVRLIG